MSSQEKMPTSFNLATVLYHVSLVVILDGINEFAITTSAKKI